MTFAAIMANIQPALAAPNVNVKNWAYIDPLPDKVGVGQGVTLIYGIDHVHPLTSPAGPFFTGFTVKITAPDGTTQTMSNLPVDSTSFGHLNFIPDKVGTYQLQMSFAGMWVNLTAGQFAAFGFITEDLNQYYEPATSVLTPLIVQAEPVPGIETYPLPTDYWTTPIYSENKGWAAKTDNWLMMAYDQSPHNFNGLGAFSPYTTGPESSHILWTKQLQMGGLVSAKFGDKSYYPSEIYEQYYQPVILNGYIYYVEHTPNSVGTAGSTGSNRNENLGTRCISLYTGEEIFFAENVTIDLAQTLDIELPNKHGILPYLWSIPGINSYSPFGGNPAIGLTWEIFDAFTGVKLLRIENATGGNPTFGPNGELLIYSLGGNGKWLTLWNSTKCFHNPTGTAAFSYSPSRGTIVDWKKGIEWNVTVNTPNAIGNPAIFAISLEDNRLLVLHGARLFYPQQQTYPAVLTDSAYPATLAKDASGNYPTTINPAWVQNRTNIYDFVEVHFNINEGMYSVYDDAELKVHTYDITSGAELSVSEPLSEGRLYTVFAHTFMAYGNTYVWSYDGHVLCVDGKTGTIEWDSYLGDLPLGQAYDTPPVYQGPTIADGKVYIGTSDHSPDSNMWVGSKMFVFDAFTGEGLWNITGYYAFSAVSNGYLTTYNGYNVQITTFGKGPSKTTVSAPSTSIMEGESIVISGTVTDQSPGQKDVACVSEESMTAWMSYLHMQKPIPTDATGVSVSIDVLDANDNHRNIGTATTDTSGFYSFVWKPDISGKFTVFARFAGSTSYGSSYAEAAFNVERAPEATPEPTQAPASLADQYFMPMSIGIIAAIAIVGIAILLMLRKK
jgi:outer membrane protein assembly factor BamB